MHIAHTPPAQRREWLLPIMFTAWFLSYWSARALLERSEASTAIRVVVALIPVPIFGACLWKLIQSVRRLDELQRRMHLEALAIAFPLAILLLMTLGLMQRAVGLRFEDWSYAHVWIYLPIFYLLGLAIARRRYS